MKLLKYIICTLVLTAGLSSCSITRHKAYAPNMTQLTLQMDDLTYLGELTISVEYRKYLGFIKVIDKINDVAYDGDGIKNFPVLNNRGFCSTLLPNLNRASVKLLEKYPDADYFIVVNQKQEKDVLFLGSNVTATAKVKAYSLK